MSPVWSRFWQARWVRALARNRLALMALGIIALYAGVGLAVMFSGITLQAAEQVVGPMSVRGLWLPQSPEKRLRDADFYLNEFRKVLRQRDLASGLAGLAFAERRPARVPTDELRARHARAVDLSGRLHASPDLDADPSLEPLLRELEAAVADLFEPMSRYDRLAYGLRMSLGTDRQGRSIMMRALYSIKVALQVGCVVALTSVLLGALLGAVAAYFGGWVDHLVVWLYSTLSSVPDLVLLAVLVFMFTGSVFDDVSRPALSLVPVYAAMCLTFWIGPCRMIRGEVMKLRELEYVQAATAIGFGRWYILRRHVLPNTLHLLFINFSLLFIAAIKFEVVLSFLGLGVKVGPSWGRMIYDSTHEVINGFFWQIGAATAFMFVLVLAFNIVSDALQDAFDPKHVAV